MMKKYTDYIDSITVDESQHEEIMAALRRKSARPHGKRPVLRYAGLAACAAVLVLGIFMVRGLLDKPGGNPDNPSQGSALVNTPYDKSSASLSGLPAGSFKLSELHNPSNTAASRIALSGLSDFFTFARPAFAFVRVTQAEEWTDGQDSWQTEKQTSTVELLSVVWSEAPLPETLSVTQSKYGGCCADEATNLLRVGGVYLLPLVQREEGDWRIYGDLDVLFEVDDQGRIWSHSTFEGMNRFDGQDASLAADAISAMTSDENFRAAASSFGYIVNEWGVLTEVTVLSSARANNEWGYAYSLRVESVLSSAENPWYSWRPENGETISVLAGAEAELEEGARYLLLLDPSEGGPYLDPSKAAKVNGNGTITPAATPDGQNVFEDFDGLTVSQIQEQAERAKAWYEAYAD